MKRDLFINGEWIETHKYKSLYAPYSGEKLAEVSQASPSDVEKAIAAAYGKRKVMERMPAHERAGILSRLVGLLQQNREECAKIIALEAAKPYRTALAEVDRTIMTFTFAAEEARRIIGEMVPMDAAPGGEKRIAFTLRKPVGVVAAITPFNFPMNLVAHKLGPAIASGNTIILKPASQTPLSSYYLATLLQQAGLPDGALNVVTGSGSEIGEFLVKDERVNAITFTGSPEVGKAIREQAGLKKVTLELGSNSALIIDQDTNLATIIDRVVTGAFSYSGQVCISIQRIYVHEQVYDEFMKLFVDATQKLKLGDPLDKETDVSSLISKSEVERTQLWIQEAVRNGGKIVSGGKLLKNNMVEPTILTHVSNKDKVSCQEAFAPLVVVTAFSTLSEAISAVNDSIYGLQAGFYTKDITQALYAAEELEVGGVMINDIPTYRVDQMPYGGVKQSGVGREGIKYAIEEMTELKLVCINK